MKKNKQIILIDDEQSSLSLLTEYLQDVPGLRLLKTCSNGFEAVAAINKLQPDLIFLDIEMPGKNGFDVLEELIVIPLIIFTTAHDEFALKAFEVNALDYLLKPYTKNRFLKAVDKAMALDLLSAKGLNNLMAAQATTKYAERLFAVYNNRLFNIDTETVVWIEADGDYTRIHTSDQFFISGYTMTELEARLDPAKFVRVHRSSIISIAYISDISTVNSSEVVTMKNKERVSISRGYLKKFKKLLSSW